MIASVVSFLLWDDASLRCQSNLPLTNYQRLKADGITFDNVQSPTVCRTSLGVYITGQEPWNSGIRNLDSIAEARDDLFSFARAHGYKIAGAGKFWEPQPAIHDPYSYAIDYWFDAGCPEHDPPLQFARQTVQPLMDWVHEHPDKIFLCPWPMLPHTPYDAIPCPASWVPPAPIWVTDVNGWISQTRRFYGNHSRLDVALGEMIRQLPKDTTWVICNDNGITQSEMSWQFSKQSPYQDGARVEFVISPWPNPGVVDHRLLTSLDVQKIIKSVLVGKPKIPDGRAYTFTVTYARGGHNWELDRPMAATIVTADGWEYVRHLVTWNLADEAAGDVTWKHPFVALPSDPVRFEGQEELFRLPNEMTEVVNAQKMAELRDLCSRKLCSAEPQFCSP